MSCFAFELHFLSVTGLLAITLGDYHLHPKMHFQNLIGLKLQSSVIACFSNLSHTLGISLPLDLHHQLSLANFFNFCLQSSRLNHMQLLIFQPFHKWFWFKVIYFYCLTRLNPLRTLTHYPLNITLWPNKVLSHPWTGLAQPHISA